MAKKLIVFDLDGTLAASQSSLDADISSLPHNLLGVVKVAIISGGAWLQFEKQVLSNLPRMSGLQSYLICSPVEQNSFNTPESGRSSIQKILLWKKSFSIGVHLVADAVS